MPPHKATRRSRSASSFRSRPAARRTCSRAEKLTEVLGASVVVDNRGGAGGTLGSRLAARAAPDGYTIMLTSPSHTFAPTVYKNLPYDTLRDFKPITLLAQTPNTLV